jgi:hypothetical protein
MVWLSKLGTRRRITRVSCSPLILYQRTGRATLPHAEQARNLSLNLLMFELSLPYDLIVVIDNYRRVRCVVESSTAGGAPR